MNKLIQFKQLPKVWLHLMLIIVTFYALPLIGTALPTGSGGEMLLMLFVIPVCCFVISLFVGTKISFNAVYVGIVALSFVPTIFIYYNYTAWLYVFVYGIIALVGNITGKYVFANKS